MAIVDKKTPRLGLLLPNADNFLQDDVERLIQSFDLLDVLVVMRDQTTGKIADDQLSEVIARLDAQGKIATSALPSSVVQKGADGKIDASVLPSIAIIDSFPVPNEASMLGLQCERGDVAIRTDLGRSFILTDLPPSKLSNWRELTSTNVTSVNGQVGAITGLAKAGVNDDITQLTALSGPLRLGGEAAGDYDAVTLKQLRAASGGAGGASMNGVMNNFIGAVEWFNGSRAKLPAGYIAADGQLVSRTDPATADLWAAVNAGIYASAATDAEWINSGIANALWNNRGMYSPGDGSTTFRVPDLNSQFNDPDQNLTPQGLFLRSHGRLTGNGVGNIIENAAPDIQGTFQVNTRGPNGYGLYVNTEYNNLTKNAFYITPGPEGGYSSKVLNGHLPDGRPIIGLVNDAAGAPADGHEHGNFAASKHNATYGRFNSSEIRPNAALGIWIIRASGTFTAQNSNFMVIDGVAAEPPTNVVVSGGKLSSHYQVNGVNRYSAELYSRALTGAPLSAAVIRAYDDLTKESAELMLETNTLLTTPGNVRIRPPLMSGLQGNGADKGNGLVMIDTSYPGHPTGTNVLGGQLWCRTLMNDTLLWQFGMYNETNVGTMTSGVLTLQNLEPGGSNVYWRFDNNGSAIALQGVWANGASDIRVKKDFKPIENPLSTMRKIKAGTWRMNVKDEEGRFGIGVLANGLYDDYPEAAVYRGDVETADGKLVKDVLTTQAGDSGVLAAVHHAAILVLMDEIEALKAQLNPSAESAKK